MIMSGKLYTEGHPMFGPDAPETVHAILDYDTKILAVFTTKSTETHVLGSQDTRVFKWSNTFFHYGENPVIGAMKAIREQYEADNEPVPDGVRALEL